jgi:hypothetical protein
MEEIKVEGFSHGDAYYAPVWIEPDGTEWIYEGIWEGCEYGMEPFDPDNFDPVRAKQILSRDPSEECPNFPVEYVGRRGKIRIQRCAEHFEREIKPRCRVRWAEMTY